MSSMIPVDDYAIAIQEGKHAVKIRTQIDGMKRVHRAIKGTLAQEVKKQRQLTSSRSSRSKKALKEHRQAEVVDGVRLIQDQVLFCVEDVHSRMFQFHSDKQQLYSLLHQYLQRQEVILVDQKSKWMLRVTPFTQQVMEDLNEVPESTQEQAHITETKQKANALIYVLQHLSKEILCDRVIAYDYRLAFSEKDEEDEGNCWQHPLVLFYAMQLLSMYCHNESQRCLHHQVHHDVKILRGLVKAMLRTFEKIDEIDDLNDRSKYILLPLLLPITIQACRSFADLLTSNLLHDGALFETQNKKASSQSAEEQSTKKSLIATLKETWQEYAFDISDYVIKWTKVLTDISPDQPLLSIIRKSFLGECSIVTDILHSANHLAHGMLKIPFTSSNNKNMTRKLSMIAKPTAINIPTAAADHKGQPMKVEGEDVGMKSLRLCHGLLSNALQLGAKASSSYAMILGPPGHPYALINRDMLFYAVHDNEIAAGMECIATAYSIGYLEAKSLIILHDARNIIHHRYQAIVLSLSFLKCALAAAMCYMKSAEKKSLEQGVDYENMRDTDKDPLAIALGALVERILMILCAHRTSLGICHKCLILLRVLMREVFLKRAVIEDLCCKPLQYLLDPWIDAESLNHDDDEDDDNLQQMVENNNMNEIISLASSSLVTDPTGSLVDHNASIASTEEFGGMFQFSSLEEGSTATKDDCESKSNSPSRTSSRGTDAPRKPDASIIEYLKKLRKELMSKAYLGDQQPPLPITLSGLLHYIVETHVQTAEVMEQALLLVEHIASKSSLGKYLLVEAGIPFMLTRYLDTQPDSLYIVALCEICVEALEL